MPKKELTLAKQVEKICSDRVYLRTVIETMLAVNRDARPTKGDQIKPAIVGELQAALERTAD